MNTVQARPQPQQRSESERNTDQLCVLMPQVCGTEAGRSVVANLGAAFQHWGEVLIEIVGKLEADSPDVEEAVRSLIALAIDVETAQLVIGHALAAAGRSSGATKQ